jgi:hypothetical protein
MKSILYIAVALIILFIIPNHPKAHFDLIAEQLNFIWEKTKADPIVFYTFLLTVFTAILATITGTLARYTFKLFQATFDLGAEAKATSTRQAQEMQKSLIIAQESADAALKQALATQESADAAMKQALASNAMFVHTARPRLIPRQIEMIVISSNQPIGIRYVWANTGGTPANIYETTTAVFMNENGYTLEPTTEKYYALGETQVHDPIAIAAGSFMVFNAASKETYKPEIINEIELGLRKLFVIGYTLYKDDTDAVRKSAFARVYNPSTKRFTTIDDPDYEYAD